MLNKKTIAFLLLSLMLSLGVWTGPVQAQTELENNQEASEESTISNIKKVIQDKQLELGQNGQQRASKQAYLAQVKRVSAETLTVKNNKGSKIIPLSNDLEITKAKQVVSVDKIVVDDWVIVYGVMENDTFVAKKVAITGKDFTQDNRKVVLGAITELYPNNLTINPRASEEKISFALDKNTKYFDLTGESARINDFYEDLQCLVVAKADRNGKMIISSLKALAAF